MTLGWFGGFVLFFGKLLIFLFIFVWFRATLPRLRYDQLMNLGWKALIPVSLLWLIVLGGIRIAQNGDLNIFDSTNANVALVLVASLVLGAVGWALLRAAMDTARDERLKEAGLHLTPVPAPAAQNAHAVSSTEGAGH